MTRAFWSSAMVAALFAWHPLHVESVAWVAERKDVLSGLFWMLALYAYARYVEEFDTRSARFKWFYGLTVLFFALGLMAKPMVITLPCALLLLDWWPLGRLKITGIHSFRRLILEKLPFFLIAAAASVTTVIAQNRVGAVATLQFFPLAARISNALVGYLRYTEKLFWPSQLSVIYPLHLPLPALDVALAVLFLAAISALAILLWKGRPYWLVGWLWFLGVLAPMIGLVQVGGQSMADRFSYIPSIGIFIIVCWTIDDLTRPWQGRAVPLALLAAVALAACARQCRAQVGYWQNSGTLFRHALAIDPDNSIAHTTYGLYLCQLGQLQQARLECQRAVEIMPSNVIGYIKLCNVLELEGKTDEAMAVLRASLKVRPDFSDAHCELAALLLEKGRYAEAQNELEEGLQFDPAHPQLHLYLGYALARQLHYEAAEREFAQAARLAPSDPASHFQWALALAAQHKTREAAAQYRAALQLQPDLANALNNLAWLLSASPDPQLRDGAEAVQLASRACALTHTNEAIKIETLANACAEAGRFGEAVAWAQKASEVALAHGQTNVAAQNLELQKLYHAHRAFYEYQ
jgi:tetratricopeptide (TPR) repeat protein